ncbi:MAG: DUF3501 family protein [Burkholderiales bacterium]
MLNKEDLFSLEQYSKVRGQFRADVIEHKKNRKVHLGEHMTMLFEDKKTIQYQIQEMLRVEKIFEEDGILDELSAYVPLIPDGSNWKATLLIEYSDEIERKAALGKLIGVEDKVWVQIEGFEKVFPIADEDLERENSEKTSSVHFLRFELTAEMKNSLKEGSKLMMGVDHDNYAFNSVMRDQVRLSLLGDLMF